MPVSKLPANLRSLRETNGYSQEYVSRQIHIARQTYSVYETGKRTPDLSTLLCLSAFYNISLDQLVYGSPSDSSGAEGILRDHGAAAPDNSLIRLSGADAKMLMDYKGFPVDTQREVRDFVRFKKYLLSREG